MLDSSELSTTMATVQNPTIYNKPCTALTLFGEEDCLFIIT
jgi:hypothetical protein